MFPQHTLPDGRWLDDVIGPRWALLQRRGLRLTPELQAQAQSLGLATPADCGDRIDAWLAEQGLVAVLLRPDRYVRDAATRWEELPSLLSGLH